MTIGSEEAPITAATLSGVEHPSPIAVLATPCMPITAATLSGVEHSYTPCPTCRPDADHRRDALGR